MITTKAAAAKSAPAEREFPTIAQLQAELRRERYRRSIAFSLRSTLFTLVTVAAAAVLIAALLMPVLQICGSSMTPTLSEGEIVVSVKGTQLPAFNIWSNARAEDESRFFIGKADFQPFIKSSAQSLYCRDAG